jgi:hypothetical protein
LRLLQLGRHSKGALGRCYVYRLGVAEDEARGLALGRESAAAGSCFGQFVAINDAGVVMKLGRAGFRTLYCGRKLGMAAIPGSGGPTQLGRNAAINAAILNRRRKELSKCLLPICSHRCMVKRSIN